MFKDPTFIKELKRQWNEAKPLINLLPQYIDEQVDMMYNAQARNFKRWNSGSGTNGWRGSVNSLENFIIKQTQWLNKAINNL